MRATTVRVQQEVKQDLDRLQDQVASQEGSRPSHSELLARMVHFVDRRESEFFEEPNVPRRRRWSRERFERFLGGLPRSGPRTDARRVDEVLYGGEP